MTITEPHAASARRTRPAGGSSMPRSPCSARRASRPRPSTRSPRRPTSAAARSSTTSRARRRSSPTCRRTGSVARGERRRAARRARDRSASKLIDLLPGSPRALRAGPRAARFVFGEWVQRDVRARPADTEAGWRELIGRAARAGAAPAASCASTCDDVARDPLVRGVYIATLFHWLFCAGGLHPSTITDLHAELRARLDLVDRRALAPARRRAREGRDLSPPRSRRGDPPPPPPRPPRPDADSPDTLRLTLDDAVAAARSATRPRPASARAGVEIGRRARCARRSPRRCPQITGTVTYNRKFDSSFQRFSSDTIVRRPDLLAQLVRGGAQLDHRPHGHADPVVGGPRRRGHAAARHGAQRGALAQRDEALADVGARGARRLPRGALRARGAARSPRTALAQARAHLAQVKLLPRRRARARSTTCCRRRWTPRTQEPAAVAARNGAEQALLRLRQLLDLPAAAAARAAHAAGVRRPASVPVLAATAGDGADPPGAARRRTPVGRAASAARRERGALAALHGERHRVAPGVPDRVAAGAPRPVRARDRRLAQLEWPLFQGFRTFGSVQRATAELRQAEAQRDAGARAWRSRSRRRARKCDRALATLVARRGTACARAARAPPGDGALVERALHAARGLRRAAADADGRE